MKSAFSNNGWKDWHQIVDGTLCIQEHMPVSKISRFGDRVWDFSNTNKPRMVIKTQYQLTVNWGEYEEILPRDILYSVKIFGFFCVYYPAVISSSRRVGSQGLAPEYYCQLMRVALSFLAELCVQAAIPTVGTNSVTSYIQNLSDITVLDIQRAFPYWRTKSLVELLRKVLRSFTSPLIQQYLPIPSSGGAPVTWTAHDIEMIDLPNRVKSPSGEGVGVSDKPLPDDLFTFLVNTATKDVLSFLVALGKVPCAPVRDIGEHEIFSSYKNFNEVYEGYLKISEENREEVYRRVASGSTSRTLKGSTSRTSAFRNKYGVSCEKARATIERAQTAAKYLLLQFTGVRYSEAVLLQKDCLNKLPIGDYVIKGTVSKNQSINLLTGLDYWIACPIVRDAVAVLEEITRLNGCEYLFATNRYSAVSDFDKPVSNLSFNNMLTCYLYDVDKLRKYSSDSYIPSARQKSVQEPYRITSHRLRHTLALHMSRAGLSIPYISLHLKHVYQAHKRFQSVQNVTLGYGGIGSDIFNNAVGFKQASREVANALYHPDAPVAGPGAEEFKQNRASYFTGMLSAGWEMDELMEHLAMQGRPMADVGLGYCKGRREIEENGVKQLPPCLGQLKCNPNRCKNAIITSAQVPIWVQVYKENHKRLNDPLLAHGWPEYAQFVEEAKQVLSTLGINVEEL